ncbi:MAG TPA: type II toxin-antitoxin system VapC family toxin, partial [Candidatus Deferrimicrobium sp.]|nr:type II toxin-antitoxin system VapC family toxin [Candidatus Deferrimicrobium sp.]
MAKPLICLDTSVLIDYFRKENKSKTFFFKLAKDCRFAISVLTKFEILVGSNEQQKEFWEQLFRKFEIIPLDQEEVEIASEIIKKLKPKNKLIE